MKTSSFSIFNNEKAKKFVIHYTGSQTAKTEIKLTEVPSLTAKHIISTHPTGQSTKNASVFRRRAENVESLLIGDRSVVAKYTGKVKTEYGSITVDAIRTIDQFVAVVIYGDEKVTRNSRREFVAFTSLEVSSKCSVYRSKTFNNKANGVTGLVVDYRDTEDSAKKASDIMRQIQGLVDNQHFDAFQLVTQQVIKLNNLTTERREEYNYEREAKIINGIDNGRSVTTELDQYIRTHMQS